jgi:exodeoxyribonuclease VII small subunit
MAKKNTKDVSTVTFETALERLEKLVAQMEQGDLPLEEAMGKYAEGIELSRICLEKLQAAEKAVDKLITETGEAPLLTNDLLMEAK